MSRACSAPRSSRACRSGSTAWHGPLRARRDRLVRARRRWWRRPSASASAARPRSWAGSSTTTGTRGSCCRWRPARGVAGRARRPRAGGRADGRAGGLRPGGRDHLPPVGSVVRPLLAGLLERRRGPAAHRLRARRHRHRAGLRHRPAAHRGDRDRRLAGRGAPGRLRLRDPRHDRPRHRAGVARLAARRARPRAPSARRAGLARRAHARRRDGPRRLRPRAPPR